jgi:hypothetical protein
VLFERASDQPTAAQVDEAYRTKYAHYGKTYVTPMTADPAKRATLRLMPLTNQDK